MTSQQSTYKGESPKMSVFQKTRIKATFQKNAREHPWGWITFKRMFFRKDCFLKGFSKGEFQFSFKFAFFTTLNFWLMIRFTLQKVWITLLAAFKKPPYKNALFRLIHPFGDIWFNNYSLDKFFVIWINQWMIFLNFLHRWSKILLKL